MNRKKLYENILKEILEHANIGIHIINKEGKTLKYNQAMADLEGLEIKQVIGKNIFELFPDLDQESSTLFKATKNGQFIIDNIQTYNNFKGKSITTIGSTIPLYIKKDIVGALEIANNLTNLKELSDQIIELQNELTVSKNKKPSKDINERKYYIDNIIGNSEKLNRCKSIVRMASTTSSNVLIYGETGTGKEMFAQSIHNEGIRKDYPFIAQNCAAIPESLLEGILFGTDKGGFTDAVERKGIFEQAKGGTLLLDEINSMPINLQAKLLRVLQEGYVRRIGGTTDIPIEVRVIATTNEDPITAMEEGSLRRDLYYRLGVVNISIPPLNARLDDIPLLYKHFINKYNDILDKNVQDISDNVLDRFYNYTWPGNVRELENVIESAMNMINYDDKILEEKDFLSNQYANINNKTNNLIHKLEKKSLTQILKSIEKELIFNTLQEQEGNITQTAKQLGIKRQTLQHKIKGYK